LHAASIVRATIATFQALGYARMPCVRVVETQGVEYAATKRLMDGSVAAFFLPRVIDRSCRWITTARQELLIGRAFLQRSHQRHRRRARSRDARSAHRITIERGRTAAE
jgi:hypothetical protein